MTRWHTDGPIPPVASLRPLPCEPAVAMFRSDWAARENLRTAQAFYRRRLRDWAERRRQAGNLPPSDEPDRRR